MARVDRIVTDYWPKPVPSRSFDWSAVRHSYDGDSMIGYGSTEAEAIEDLIALEAEQ